MHIDDLYYFCSIFHAQKVDPGILPCHRTFRTNVAATPGAIGLLRRLQLAMCCAEASVASLRCMQCVRVSARCIIAVFNVYVLNEA